MPSNFHRLRLPHRGKRQDSLAGQLGRVLPCRLVLRKIRFALPEAVDDEEHHPSPAAAKSRYKDQSAEVSTKFTSAKNATNAKTSAATSMFYLQKRRPPNAMEGRLKA
ncbi:hypothetical protein AZH46_10560 [Corynebacterium striatum]|nr:hypothetical protein AZH46_10560 [Corynebacterium striatum]